ncbi:hypothetical protein D041_0435, partial [Vibrio parahaemolyticus EKP-008]
MELSKVLRV